jgi:AraC-like DNA-binding protein
MAFNGRFLLNMAYLATRQGGDISGFIQLTNKTIEELNEESCTIENNVYNNVVELAVAISQDPFFGLHAGENLNLAAAGLIVQLSQSSETVKEALELCCEFSNLGCSVLPLELVVFKEFYKVVLRPDELWKNESEISFRHTTDGVLAFTIKEFASLTRLRFNPLAVHVSWGKFNNTAEYERVFGCPVFYNQDEVAILFRKEHIEEKVITANYELLNLLVVHAAEKSAALNQKLGFVAVVKHCLLNLMKLDYPTLNQVSGHLNMSPRTLQRKLKNEGYTYKLLIDELRKDFAMKYLKKSGLTISEIAYLTGFSNASTFNRSFKRWTGLTPNAYRNE